MIVKQGLLPCIEKYLPPTAVQQLSLKQSDYMSLHCDHDLENSKPLFSQDTLAHDADSSYQGWLQKIKQFRRNHPDKHSLKFRIFAVTLTLNTTKQSNLSKRQSSLSHQTKSGNKGISISED